MKWYSPAKAKPEPFKFVWVYIPSEAPHPSILNGHTDEKGNWHTDYVDRRESEIVAWAEKESNEK